MRSSNYSKRLLSIPLRVLHTSCYLNISKSRMLLPVSFVKKATSSSISLKCSFLSNREKCSGQYVSKSTKRIILTFAKHRHTCSLCKTYSLSLEQKKGRIFHSGEKTNNKEYLERLRTKYGPSLRQFFSVSAIIANFLAIIQFCYVILAR